MQGYLAMTLSEGRPLCPDRICCLYFSWKAVHRSDSFACMIATPVFISSICIPRFVLILGCFRGQPSQRRMLERRVKREKRN